MADLVAMAFENPAKAFDMRARLAELQKEYLIDMEDVVVVTRDDNGKVELHQVANLTAAGAVGGSFWGMLIGMLFFNPLLGLAAGAGSGALAGYLTDIGIDNKFMKSIGEDLKHLHGPCDVRIRPPAKAVGARLGFPGSHGPDIIVAAIG